MTHLALAVTRNATKGELAMRCNQTPLGCLDGERMVGEHSLRGKPKSLSHQPRAVPTLMVKRQRLQMKHESNLCRGEILSRL